MLRLLLVLIHFGPAVLAHQSKVYEKKALRLEVLVVEYGSKRGIPDAEVTVAQTKTCTKAKGCIPKNPWTYTRKTNEHGKLVFQLPSQDFSILIRNTPGYTVSNKPYEVLKMDRLLARDSIPGGRRETYVLIPESTVLEMSKVKSPEAAAELAKEDDRIARCLEANPSLQISVEGGPLEWRVNFAAKGASNTVAYYVDSIKAEGSVYGCWAKCCLPGGN